MNTSRLLEELLNLPLETRAVLAGTLIESLDDPPDSDAEVAWETEIASRLRELDASDVKTVPWAEARRIITGD